MDGVMFNDNSAVSPKRTAFHSRVSNRQMRQVNVAKSSALTRSVTSFRIIQYGRESAVEPLGYVSDVVSRHIDQSVNVHPASEDYSFMCERPSTNEPTISEHSSTRTFKRLQKWLLR